MAAGSRWLNATAHGPWASRSWRSSRVWAVWSEALAQRSWPFRVAEGGLMMSGGGEQPDGVSLTNLDQPLFDGADATKRDLVDYLDAVADHIIPELADRPLSVIRVLRGQAPFMQKNVPSYTPSWVRTVSLWAETSKRDVSYALCNDR